MTAISRLVTSVFGGSVSWPPNRILALGDEGSVKCMRVVYRPDGDIRLKPVDEGATRGAVVLAIAPQALFRRRAKGVPRVAEHLRIIAADLFPFPESSTSYAAVEDETGDAWFFALPDELHRDLERRFGAASAILPSETRPVDLLAALRRRFEAGPITDLRRPPLRFVYPGAVVAGAWLAAAVGLIILAFSTWQHREAERLAVLRTELARLEAVAQPLAERRRIVGRMSAAIRAVDELEQSPISGALRPLGEVLVAVPPGARIDHILLREGGLLVEGLGDDAPKWLSPLGIPASRISVAARPVADRFSVRLPIGPHHDDANVGYVAPDRTNDPTVPASETAPATMRSNQ